jgi:hypothetical protein
MAISESVATPSYQVLVPRSALAEELVSDEQLRYEPLVMLQVSERGVSARKLTMREKLAHTDHTGGSVFAGSEEELEEMFDLLKEPSDQSAS